MRHRARLRVCLLVGMACVIGIVSLDFGGGANLYAFVHSTPAASGQPILGGNVEFSLNNAQGQSTSSAF